MKKYSTPEIKVLAFEATDLMIASGNELAPDLVDNNLNIQDIQDI